MKKLYAFIAFLLSFCLFCMPVIADIGDVIPAGIGEAATNVATEDFLTDPYADLGEIPTNTTAFTEVKAATAVLMEASTGRILFEQKPDEPLPPASVTKVMSLLLVMEAMEAGKFTAETMVTASDNACSLGGSQIWLEPGETMSVNDLLKATCIASANDATVALGELVAGTEEAFVAQMNARAKELGMHNTVFMNSTGLDATGHVTTSRDIAIMSCELLKHELIKTYSTVWMDSLRGGQSELVNTNKLVRFYKGAVGLKTGTTSGAGYCLSAAAVRDDMALVSVVMGADTSNNRFNSARQLLDYGFANWSRSEVHFDTQTLPPVAVTKGVANTLTLNEEAGVSLLVPKGKAGEVTQKLFLQESFEAPIAKGQALGYVVLELEGKEIGRISLVALEDVPKMTFSAAFARILSALFTL